MAAPEPSFVDIPKCSDFPLQNLPWGVYTSSKDSGPQIGVALGDYVVNVTKLQASGCFSGPELSSSGRHSCFQQGSLNAFMSAGRPAWREARATLQRLLSAREGALRDDARLRDQVLLPRSEVAMQLPADIGDYTDFYASRYHAANVGEMFRGKGNELNPNWVHLPVGYHGRASSVVVSGSDFIRPWGQVLPGGCDRPVVRPSAAVDFELEVACLIGPGNPLGAPIPVDSAADHIFGLVLMNDWSARDVQKWEYVPLGPFNGKNWATQISPWVVPMDALEPFACEAPKQDPAVLPYLTEAVRSTYDVQLSVDIIPAGYPHRPTRVTTSNLRHLYWTFPQMLAHHTLGGCNMRPGDLLGSGTISGPDPGSRGSLLEVTWGGTRPLTLEVGGGWDDGRDSDAGEPGHRDEKDELGSATAAAAAGPPASSPPAAQAAAGGGGGSASGTTSAAAAAAGAAAGVTSPPRPATTRTYLADGDSVVMRGWCQRASDGLRIGFGECRGRLLAARPLGGQA